MSKKTVKRVALLLAAVLLLALAGCGSSGSTKTPEYPTPEKPITIQWCNLGIRNPGKISA